MSYEVQLHVKKTEHKAPITAIEHVQPRAEVLTAAEDGRLKAWDEKTGNCVRQITGAHSGYISDMQHIEHHRVVVTVAHDATVKLWTESLKLLEQCLLDGPLYCCCWNERHRMLVCGSRRAISVIKLSKSLNASEYDRNVRKNARSSSAAGQSPSASPAPASTHLTQAQTQTAVSSDAASLVSSPGATQSEHLLSKYCSLHVRSNMVLALTCSPDGRTFAGCDDGSLLCVDGDKPTSTTYHQSNCHAASVRCIDFDANQDRLLTCAFDGKVRLWTDNLRYLEQLLESSENVYSVCYAGSVKSYWISSRRNRVVVYDPLTPAEITHTVEGAAKLKKLSISHIKQANHSCTLIGSTPSRGFVVWKYNSTASFRSLSAHDGWVECMSLVRRSNECEQATLFTGGSDGLVKRWVPNTELNTEMYHNDTEFKAHNSSVRCLAYNSALDLLVTGGEDGWIGIWSLELVIDPVRMEERKASWIEYHKHGIVGVACLPKCVLCTASSEGSLAFWDLHTFRKLETIDEAHTHAIHCIESVAEREEVATAAYEASVKIWDTFQFILKHTLSGHTADITDVCFLHTKEFWATASDDKCIALWSTDGEPLQWMRPRGKNVTALAEDRLNHLLLVATDDLVMRAYSLSETEPTMVDKYTGHRDIIKSIVHVEDMAHYVCGAWDSTVRVFCTWQHETRSNEGASTSSQKQQYGHARRRRSSVLETTTSNTRTAHEQDETKTPDALLDSSGRRGLSIFITQPESMSVKEQQQQVPSDSRSGSPQLQQQRRQHLHGR